jgi:hypothetical protein
MAYFGSPADGLKYFDKDDWADVFQRFADEPARDWSGEYRSSTYFVKYIATPISVRQRTPARPGSGAEVSPPIPGSVITPRLRAWRLAREAESARRREDKDGQP